MSTPKIEDRPAEEVHNAQYTNAGKMPEYNLALFIAGTLAAHGLIQVSNQSSGYEDFQDAVNTITRCLCGLIENPRAEQFASDQLFDFVMDKP